MSYLVFCPQLLQSHKGKVRILLFIPSPFHHNCVYVNEGDFAMLPEEPARYRGLELPVLPSDFWGDEGGWRLNQWPVSYLVMPTIMQPPLRIQKDENGFGNFYVGVPECFSMPSYQAPSAMRVKAPLFWTSTHMSLHLAIDL